MHREGCSATLGILIPISGHIWTFLGSSEKLELMALRANLDQKELVE